LERSSYLVEIESELENSFLTGIAAEAGYICKCLETLPLLLK
jgi:hypothetical protein